MRERIRFLVLYFLFWVVFFLITRILFLGYHIDNAKLLTLETVYGVFKHGIRLDLATAAYFSFIPFFWVTFSNFINKSFFQWAIFTYTFFLLITTSLITVIDLEVFNIWNFRMDITPLKYLSSPKAAYLTVRNSPLLKLFITFSILMVVAGTIVYRMVSNKIYDWKHIKAFPFIIYGLLLSAVLIIPIRGGFSSEKLTQKSVYFSEDYFANVSTLNAPWNFAFSIVKKSYSHINPYNYLPKEDLDNQVSSLFAKSENTKQVVQTNAGYPNILMILVENLSNEVLNLEVEGIELTPGLNNKIRSGIYFNKFYATGGRSDKTIASILSGSPSLPTESILDYPDKFQQLPVISEDLNGIGYSTAFYYGGDADFLGIKQYLFNSKFEKIIEKEDFKGFGDKLGLGYTDEAVYNKFIADHKVSAGQPFFSTLLTVSSHEPFDIPNDSLQISSGNSLDKYYSAIRYTDRSLSNFLEAAKEEDWWRNTLIIIVGNHGYSLSGSIQNVDSYEVPMIWTGGAIRSNQLIDLPFSQSDIVASILAQLHLSTRNYPWSKNIFDTKVNPWAFLTFNDGFGYIDTNDRYMFDNIGESIINNVEVNTNAIMAGKALQQKSYQDFLDL